MRKLGRGASLSNRVMTNEDYSKIGARVRRFNKKKKDLLKLRHNGFLPDGACPYLDEIENV